MAKKILITGANGFIGSHLTRACMKSETEIFAAIGPSGDTTRIADILDSISVVKADLLNKSSMECLIKDIQPDICFQMAWFVDPATYRNSPINISWIKATADLFNVLADNDCQHFIGAGTCFEYDVHQGLLDETSAIKPQNIYSACKLATFHVLEQLAKNTGIKFSWARIFYQYGSWENPLRLVPHIITNLLAGQPVELSSGKQIKDYLHITDVAAALFSISEFEVEGIVNIGSGEEASVAKIAEIIGELIGAPELIHLGEREDNPNEPPLITANTKKLTSSTNWKPAFSLKQGLKDTISWFRENQNY